MPIPAAAVTINFDCGAADAALKMNCAGLWPFTATEVRNFMAYDGKLFMGTGMWMDPQTSPRIGPAILVLKSGNGQFEIEQQFTARDTAICMLHVANFTTPVRYTIPIASTWQSQGFNDLHYRDWSNGSWHFAQNISTNAKAGEVSPQIRSAFNYTDNQASTSLLFLGDSPNGVYSLKHDPNGRGGLGPATLELNAAGLPINPGAKQNRVMSFGIVRGKLYATIHNRLYERQNGARPTWIQVHEDRDVGSSESGFRGLTTVDGTNSANGYFFAAREGSKAAILKLVPPASAGGAWTQTVAYDMPTRLGDAWSKHYGGQVGVGYGIGGYNDMTWFQPRGASGPWALFIGIEAFVWKHPPNMPTVTHDGDKLHALGAYLVWNFQGRGEWTLNHLPAVTSQAMVSCRVGIVNPFGGTRFYIGGYDCNYERSRNTGFVVSLDMARMTEGAVA